MTTKNDMKNFLLLTLTLPFTLNTLSQSTAISIDDKFEDWNNINRSEETIFYST